MKRKNNRKMDLTQEWKKEIEDRKKQEETRKLFDELIKIDGEQWRTMVADLNQKEYEDEQKKFKEMAKEEQEDWDKILNRSGNALMSLSDIAAMIKDKPAKEKPRDHRQKLIQNAPFYDPLSFFDLNRKLPLF